MRLGVRSIRHTIVRMQEGCGVQYYTFSLCQRMNEPPNALVFRGAAPIDREGNQAETSFQNATDLVAAQRVGYMRGLGGVMAPNSPTAQIPARVLRISILPNIILQLDRWGSAFL